LVDRFLSQAIAANYEKHLFQGSSIDDGSKRQKYFAEAIKEDDEIRSSDNQIGLVIKIVYLVWQSPVLSLLHHLIL
jgi:hypothetical protein